MIPAVFPGFSSERIDVGPTAIRLVRGGDGPPLLLLHGYPQTLHMWHKVAPALAERFTVVASDLRGYGGSSKVPGDPEHLAYSKREMARDQVEAMRQLGYERFMVAGHDRGGRAAHRMALDWPEAVERLAVLDIVPTHRMFRSVTRELATVYWHWFFLSQPPDLPERLIEAAPDVYLRSVLAALSATPDAFDPEAVAEYERALRAPGTAHAICEDYRAAASIDLVHDEADLDRPVECPLLALWGERGRIHRLFDVLETWRERASDVRGRPLPCGHFLPEEAPEETAAELVAFLTR